MLQVILTRGNRNESPILGPLLGSACRLHNRRPKRLVGDKGYTSDRTRDGLLAVGIQPVIPWRSHEHVNDRSRWGQFDQEAYKNRNVIERTIAKLKEFRRIATRYEKLAESFLAIVNVAVIVLYLRQLS